MIGNGLVEEEIEYAKANGVPVPANLDNPYSVDQNLWGRANECGVLENPGIKLQKKPLELQTHQSLPQTKLNLLM